MSSGDELFINTINHIRDDVKVYSDKGIELVRALLYALNAGKINAESATNAIEEYNAVEESVIKKIVDMPNGNDLILFSIPILRIGTFAKFLYERGRIPFVACRVKEYYMVISLLSEFTVLNCAMRDCELRVESKNTVVLSNELIQSIRAFYARFIEANISRQRNEAQTASAFSNSIKDAASLSGEEILSESNIENIINRSISLLSDIQTPKDKSRKSIKDRDFAQYLVDKSMHSNTSNSQSIIYHNSSIRVCDADVSYIDSMVLLPVLKKETIEYDFVLDASSMPEEIVEDYGIVVGGKEMVGLNADDVSDFFNEYRKDARCDVDTLSSAFKYGDKSAFMHQVGLLEIVLSRYEGYRKPYQEHLRVAEEVMIDSNMSSQEKYKLVWDILGEYQVNGTHQYE